MHTVLDLRGSIPDSIYIKTARMHPYPQIWTYHGTIDDLYLQIQIERMINATLVTPIHFTGFEKQETSNGPEYLFYGSNCINYYRDVHENVISLNKMCKWSFFIVTMSIVRSLVYVTPAMLVVILVFIIAGLFSKVLSFVFEEAVGYKEENDFTI